MEFTESKNISFLFHNGVIFNLPELICRLEVMPEIDISFDHGDEFRKNHEDDITFSDFDYLAANYEELKEISIDFSKDDEVRMYFAECCLAWALYYAYNIKANGAYRKELADLKSRIKNCVKHFINSGLKSLGYCSCFHPHPNYNKSWLFYDKKSKYYKNTLKQYDNFLVTVDCCDKYFAGVLYMFLVDYRNKTLPEKNNFTVDYKKYLLGLCGWIANSADARYYRQMVNNFIINYYFWYTEMDGKKPNFYEFAPSFESQIEREKNKCLMGMLDVPFSYKKTLCDWIHYDVLFKNLDKHLEKLVKWMFGEIFYTDAVSSSMKNIYKSLLSSMGADLLENPGIVLLMYLGIQKISMRDFKSVFIPAAKTTKKTATEIFAVAISNSMIDFDKYSLNDTGIYANMLSYIEGEKKKSHDKELFSKFFQLMFYFMVWDICSSYKIRWECYCQTSTDEIKPHILFAERDFSANNKTKMRFRACDAVRGNLIANFYEPFLDGTWRNPQTLQNILNQFADFFHFKTSNTFDGLDFSTLPDGDISALETISLLIYNLSHGESKTFIIDELNYIRKQYETSANVLPNLRKEYSTDAERKAAIKRYRKNFKFLKKCDTGFQLEDFEQSFYPFDYEIMGVFEKTDKGSYRLIGWELKNEEKDYPIKQVLRISLKKQCICKFLPESDADIRLASSDGKFCKITIDKDKRFRSIYQKHFYNHYLYNDRNTSTHYASCTAINNLLGNDSADKKFILTALFDIKKSLSEMKETENNIQIIQISYLKAECDDLFKIIVRAYFESIPNDVSEWEYVFDNEGEFKIPSKKISGFNENFNALDLGYDIFCRLQSFFETVWNISNIYYDTRCDNVAYYNADFMEIYKLPIELYLIYLSLSLQKYDGTINKKRNEADRADDSY